MSPATKSKLATAVGHSNSKNHLEDRRSRTETLPSPRRERSRGQTTLSHWWTLTVTLGGLAAYLLLDWASRHVQ